MNNYFASMPGYEEVGKEALKGVSKAIDVAYGTSVEIFNRNITAAKESVERQTSYALSLKDVRKAEDLAKLQDSAVKRETGAFKDYARNVCECASNAASSAVEAADTGWQVTDKIVVGSVSKAVDALPDDKRLPVFDYVRESLRNQLGVYRTVSGVFSDAIKNVQKTVGDIFASAEAAVVTKPVSAGKRRAN